MKNKKTDVKSFYEEYPCGGDWTEGDKRHVIQPWFNEVFCYNEFKNKNILEVGCGTGIDIVLYAMGGAHVVGIDIAKKPLYIANRKIHELNLEQNVRLIQWDLEHMPFKEGSFDMCYSIGVLHHTPNPEEGLSEINRLLRDSGEIICLLYNKYSFATFFTWINRLLYNFLNICTHDKETMVRIFERFFRRELDPAEVSGFREMWEHPLIRYFSKKTAKRMFGSYFHELQMRCYDSMYPLSHFSHNSQRFDLLGNVFGKFLIVKGKSKNGKNGGWM